LRRQLASKENAEHIDQARKEALSIKSLIKVTVEEREEIEPLLISLWQQAKEFEERRKSRHGRCLSDKISY